LPDAVQELVMNYACHFFRFCIDSSEVRSTTLKLPAHVSDLQLVEGNVVAAFGKYEIFVCDLDELTMNSLAPDAVLCDVGCRKRKFLAREPAERQFVGAKATLRCSSCEAWIVTSVRETEHAFTTERLPITDSSQVNFSTCTDSLFLSRDTELFLWAGKWQALCALNENIENLKACGDHNGTYVCLRTRSASYLWQVQDRVKFLAKVSREVLAIFTVASGLSLSCYMANGDRLLVHLVSGVVEPSVPWFALWSPTDRVCLLERSAHGNWLAVSQGGHWSWWRGCEPRPSLSGNLGSFSHVLQLEDERIVCAHEDKLTIWMPRSS
jgi:hypothetical protein